MKVNLSPRGSSIAVHGCGPLRTGVPRDPVPAVSTLKSYSVSLDSSDKEHARLYADKTPTLPPSEDGHGLERLRYRRTENPPLRLLGVCDIVTTLPCDHMIAFQIASHGTIQSSTRFDSVQPVDACSPSGIPHLFPFNIIAHNI